MSTTISQRQFDFSNKGKGIIAKKAIIGGELIGISVPTPDWATNGTLETPYQFSLKLRDGTEGKNNEYIRLQNPFNDNEKKYVILPEATGQKQAINLDVGGDTNLRGNVNIGGDLIIEGTTTSLNTRTLEIEDNKLQLNASVSKATLKVAQIVISNINTGYPIGSNNEISIDSSLPSNNNLKFTLVYTNNEVIDFTNVSQFDNRVNPDDSEIKITVENNYNQIKIVDGKNTFKWKSANKFCYLLYFNKQNEIGGIKLFEQDSSSNKIDITHQDANAGLIINNTSPNIDQCLQWNIDSDCWEFIDSGNKLQNIKIADPTELDHATTKRYVEQRLSTLENISDPTSASSEFLDELKIIFGPQQNNAIYANDDIDENSLVKGYYILSYMSNQTGINPGGNGIEFGLIRDTLENSKYFVFYSMGVIVNLHQIC